MRPSVGTVLCLALVAALAAPAAAAPAFDRADLDTSCAPCRDFYQFANGGWIAKNAIPASYPSWGSFEVLAERNEAALQRILERAAAKRGRPGSPDRMLGDYYAACMDSAAAEAAGAQPVQPLLSAIDSMASAREVPVRIAWLHAHGVRAAFALSGGPDPRRSDVNIANFSQGGLGLPDRDYYTKDDSASVALRAAYLEHVERSFRLLGRPDPAGDAAKVMRVETAFASASMTNVQRRDPLATYHKMMFDSLSILICAGMDWDAYFAARHISRPDSINVQQPDFARELSQALMVRPLDEWQAYLRWKVLDDAAPMLSSAFVEEDFRFRQLQTGAKELLPRWKRCLRATDQDLGDLLGQAYVKERFPPAARARALQMVHHLEAALGDRIATLEWMGEGTRLAAKTKLEAFANKIGYPDKWRDYAGVRVARGDWTANRLACREWEANRAIQKIGRPVDKGEWMMTPPTVNAFYSSSFNSINFPAGILQPPFYDPSWDDALNYGAIGAVIGHEMTHGFDDRGRQFDGRGNLRDWWTPDDAARYKERAQKVVDQFDAYTVAGTVPVNGRLTLGENIADLGGVAVAYHALQKALEGRPRRLVDGFTPEQRFFLGWARVWRSLDRDENLVTRVKTDPHAPDAYRVNGPFSNLDEFAKAFGCKPGDAMVREEVKRARIW